MTVPHGWTAEQLAALPAVVEIDADAPGVRSRTYSVEELERAFRGAEGRAGPAGEGEDA